MANSNNKSKSKSSSAKSTSKKAPESQGKQFVLSRQHKAIILFGAAIIMFSIVFIEGEAAWAWMHNFVLSLFGFCAYLIPFSLVYSCIIYAMDRPNRSVIVNTVCSSGIVVFLSSLIQLFSNSKEYFSTVTLSEQIKTVWDSITPGRTGGLLGATVGGLLAKAFGKTGTLIILLVLMVAAVLIITGISLPMIASFIKKPIVKVGEYGSEKLEENQRKREELKEQREREEEERKQLENAVKAPPTIDSLIPEFNPGKLDEPGMPETPVSDDTPSSVKGMPAAVDGTPGNKSSFTESKSRRAGKTSVTTEKTYAQTSTPARVSRNYVYPTVDLLDISENTGIGDTMEEMQEGAKKLVATLESFKIKTIVTNIVRGPSVTRYELLPEEGVRINKITTLADDIALRLAARSVRIEAPIPGKSAIGIEIPNAVKVGVTMREILSTDYYKKASEKSKINVALGKDITGNIIMADLAKMPHLLVAGTTGSGKSVCLNSMILSILFNASPEEVKLLLIDPKMVEFTVYDGIAHLEVPVVSNPRKAAGALSWAVSEMEKRYKLFSENGVRDIRRFNKLCESNEELTKMCYYVIIIDELSDLMMTAPKEVEDSICRLAQMARAAGIHLVIATQRPSADVITGLIKNNIPSRIALTVSQAIESRIILDRGGAEKLLGNGDMLFNPIGVSNPTRVQGCYVSDGEIARVVAHIKKHSSATYNEDVIKEIESKTASAEGSRAGDEDLEDALDPVFNDAVEVVLAAGEASTTNLQKRLKLGYARASRVMDQLEECGIVGPKDGSKPREVLISSQQWYERQALADSAPKQEQLTFYSTPKTPTLIPDLSENEYQDFEEFQEIELLEEDYDEEDYYEDEDEQEQEPELVDDFADILEDDEEDEEYEEVAAEEEPEEIQEVEILEDEEDKEAEIEESEEETQAEDEIKVVHLPVENHDNSTSSEHAEEEDFEDFDDIRPINIDDIFEEDSKFSDDNFFN